MNVCAEKGPLEVVVVYAFDSTTTTPAYTKVDRVYWLVQDKIGCMASSSRLSYIYFMSSGNSCTTQKRFARSGAAIVNWSKSGCTKNMASGLGEAHRLISQCENSNGIILLLSDGLVDKNRGDFFDGAEDFVSKWPVHTFTVGENAYNQVSCLSGRGRSISSCFCRLLSDEANMNSRPIPFPLSLIYSICF